ncbi:hypothetical protein, partial [Ruminococcus sp.]|uniref:hypothetical protein n=1 Tax=Ruminococcus sp. TaxID=41978 RepID=UPI003865D73A
EEPPHEVKAYQPDMPTEYGARRRCGNLNRKRYNTPPERREGKMSDGHFSACTEEVYSYYARLMDCKIS